MRTWATPQIKFQAWPIRPLLTGSEELEAEGLAQEAKGKAEKLAGDAKQTVKNATNKVADAANKKL
jgi:hypothetical protein